jgi:membrane protease YdiL (CAAX protease family)
MPTGEPESKRGPPSGRGREISSGQVIGALLFALGLSVIASFAVLLPIIMAAGGTGALAGLETSSEFILFSLLLQDSILLAICFDQSLFQGRLTRADMGLSLKPLTRGLPWQVAIGIGAGVVTFTFSALFIDGLTRLLSPLGVPTSEEPLAGTPVIRGTYDYALWLISGCLVAPVAEEVFFRGYALGGLKKRGLTNFGLIFTSVVFAAVHMNPVGFVPLIAAGMVMGGLYLKTGSLAAPMVAHATNNFIVTTLVLLGY